MQYRVEELAAACGVSVDTIRYYQSRGLLPPPRREGRIALYRQEHVARVRTIRALQRKGLTLALIRRVLEGKMAAADEGLATAIAAAQAEGDDEEFLTLDELAQRSGVPAALLRAIEREGLAIGRRIDGEERFTRADVEMVRMGLRLLESGMPLEALLSIARDYDAAARTIAERAVDLFDEHVREPIRSAGLSDEETAAKLVAAFRELLPAVTALVAHHFRRALLRSAEEHLERTGDPVEIEASRAESRRIPDAVWGA